LQKNASEAEEKYRSNKDSSRQKQGFLKRKEGISEGKRGDFSNRDLIKWGNQARTSI
jgi:hypothetical protein